MEEHIAIDKKKTTTMQAIQDSEVHWRVDEQ